VPSGFHTDEERSIATIGVGYDGTAEATAALGATMAMAATLGARVRVINVVDVAWMGMPAMMSGPGYNMPPGYHEERARDELGKLVEGLPAGVDVEPVVPFGDAEHELVEQSGSADLMVVGSRGYGPHRAVLLGSVSGRLVRDAACPVIVVPRGIGAPLEQLFPSARAEAV
jgi:nucleotide-binding universal stress UspA family protein